jgi:glycosyltransferase involved in cell wall biosynthesis
MRIGIDARLVYYTQAGIGNYTLRLTLALAESFPSDDFVLLQDIRDSTPHVSAPNVRVARTSVASHHRVEQLVLPIVADRLRADVFHSPDFIPPIRARSRSVITIHDLAFLIYPHFVTKDGARYYGQIDRAVRKAHQIIAVSESTKLDLINFLGVPEQKITVIYEAADPLFQAIDRSAARAHVQGQYGLRDEFILFVGTIEPRKNITGLLRAYRRLRDDYKLPHQLVLAGAPGWLYEEVFELVEGLNLGEHCRFLGRVDAEGLLNLYNSAACLVHPAFYEGFGLTPLEAMACGTPAIVSKVSSMPEVVGDAALMVDPRNDDEIAVAMWRVLTNSDLREELRTKGLQRARSFSWNKAAEQTMAVYRKAIS